MKRLLIAFAFVLSIPDSSLFAQTDNPLPPVDINKIVTTEAIAKEAYLWGYPMVRFERTRKLLTTTPGYGHAPINTFFHATRLAGPNEKGMSNPLPDTLYSSAFLDLRQQPMVLQIPKITNRYYSLQFMDANTTNVSFVSSRTQGAMAGKFFITGPNFIGATPAGFQQIRASTNHLWVIGHIEAPFESDVKSAVSLLKKYDLKPYNVYLGKAKMAKTPDLVAKVTTNMDPRGLAKAGVQFFDELGTALRENEPTNLEPAIMERFRSIEVGPGLRTSRITNVREMREAYERAIASAEIDMNNTVKKDLIKMRNGWSYITRGDGFGNNYTLRAAMSKVYFAETNSIESIHPVTRVDRDNIRLNGNSTYILRFNKNRLPPVSAFWSVVTYNSRDKSLVENSLRRYSLGSYSKGLLQNPDGSVDIYISANEPSGKTTNWLPAPRGNFYVMMNMYHPSTDVISGKYQLPGLQKMTVTPILSLNK
ncbi:DUF1254 domain-containing protein [Bdellovibrio sp. HCB337]|uniref:DUF1254 domain-containing protein n=1 Tax=Bdellovibrio sp. HCB337 TaxID=3394358 RepID=UPI0039A65656